MPKATNNANEFPEIYVRAFSSQYFDSVVKQNLSCSELYMPGQLCANGRATSAAGVLTKPAKCGMSQPLVARE